MPPLNIILINVILILAGFCGYLVISIIRKNNSQSETLERFVNSLQSNFDTRKILVKRFLSDGIGLQDEGLVEDLATSEGRFLKKVVKAFYSHDDDELLQLEDELYLLLSQYHALSRDIPEPGIAPPPQGDQGADSAEVAKLQQQVQHGVEAINLVYNEYCTMFGEPTNQDDLLTVDEILERINNMGRDESRQIESSGAEPEAAPSQDEQLLAASLESTGEQEPEPPSDDDEDDILGALAELEGGEAAIESADSNDIDDIDDDLMGLLGDDDSGTADSGGDMLSDDMLSDMLEDDISDESPMDSALADIDDILSDSTSDGPDDDPMSQLLEDDDEDPQKAIDDLMNGGVESDMDLDDIASLLEDSELDDK